MVGLSFSSREMNPVQTLIGMGKVGGELAMKERGTIPSLSATLLYSIIIIPRP